MPNSLIYSTNPYLLQHAYNPVNWYEWGTESLEKAQNENKPILLSIGYSSCHWCHVMEKESFEDEAIAKLMNDYFVCIKLDREERPDIDALYMEAVQAMGISGGWPLNVFLLPDTQPFYGGTYFPPNRWKQVLESVQKGFKKEEDKLIESAVGFTNFLQMSLSEKYDLQEDALIWDDFLVEKITNLFDEDYGGFRGSPKFPVPVTLRFFLTYGSHQKNEKIYDHVQKTLSCMVRGGLYDVLGGGFSRYSVDSYWHVPHFEKMLYDNAQLLGVYAQAQRHFSNDDFIPVLYQTADFLEREMKDTLGGYFSALDADSEGVEGKYYSWKKEEIEEVILNPKDFCDFFQITETGNWIHENTNILFAEKQPINDWALRFSEEKKKLFERRQKRIRPQTDYKIISAWNGLLLSGFVDCYKTTLDEKFLNLAINLGEYLLNTFISGEILTHSISKNKKSGEGFLDDYAFVIEAFIKLYSITFDEKWLLKAKDLIDFVLFYFYDNKESLFFFCSKNGEELIASKKEIFDSVIPSSNAQMAHNLIDMFYLFENSNYIEIAEKMVKKVFSFAKKNPTNTAHWLVAAQKLTSPFYQIAIFDSNPTQYLGEISGQMKDKFYSIAATNSIQTRIPFLISKKQDIQKTTLFLCKDKVCFSKVHSILDWKILLEKEDLS